VREKNETRPTRASGDDFMRVEKELEIERGELFSE